MSAAAMPADWGASDPTRMGWTRDLGTGLLKPPTNQSPAIDAQNEQIWSKLAKSIYPDPRNQAPDGRIYSSYRTVSDPTTGKVTPSSWGTTDAYGNYTAAYTAPGYQSNYYGDAVAGGPAATGQDAGSVAAGWTPAPSYVPTPIQVTPGGTTGTPAPIPAQSGPSGSDSKSSDPQAQAPAPAPPTPWDLWQQQTSSAAGAPPPTAQTSPTVRNQGARNSVLANSVLSGGTTYQPGKNAAAFNQDVSSYQQQQNEFATTYQLMLQRLAQQAGGQTSYTPGATG